MLSFDIPCTENCPQSVVDGAKAVDDDYFDVLLPVRRPVSRSNSSTSKSRKLSSHSSDTASQSDTVAAATVQHDFQMGHVVTDDGESTAHDQFIEGAGPCTMMFSRSNAAVRILLHL